MSLIQSAQRSHSETRQVTLKTVIITFHQHLSQFLSQIVDLNKCNPQICNLNEETFNQLTQFQQQCERILKAPKMYESFSIEDRMKIFYKQKKWIQIAEELKQIQVLESPIDKSACLAATYHEFIQTKKQEKIMMKFNQNSNCEQQKEYGQLPQIPDFKQANIKVEPKIEEEREQQQIIFSNSCAQIKTEVIYKSIGEFEENLSTASTSELANSRMSLNHKRTSFKSANKESLEIVSSVNGCQTQRILPQVQSSHSSFSEKVKSQQQRFIQIEQFIIKFITDLGLDDEVSTVIFKASVAMIAFVLKSDFSDFVNKSASVIAAAVILQVSKITGYLITINSLTNIIDLKERVIAKALKQLSRELQNFQIPQLIAKNAHMDTEILIQQMACQYRISDEQTLRACNYLYNKMSVQGLVKGIRVDILASSILFLSATLNGVDISIEEIQQQLEQCHSDKLRNTIFLILSHQETLINNQNLFRLRHMLHI